MTAPEGLTAILNVVGLADLLQTTTEETAVVVEAGTVYKVVSVAPFGAD
jgi:hypothetical protein